MNLVGLALGDDQEATGDQRLARALVARHVEDGARFQGAAKLKVQNFRARLSPRIAAGTVRRAPRLKVGPRRRGDGARLPSEPGRAARPARR